MNLARPTFLYDGDCAFCSSCARFIERRIRPRAEVVAWQFADLAALGVTAAEAEQAVQWIDRGGVSSGADGVAAMLRHARGIWWFFGVLLGSPPVLWLARPLYRLVARYRHRLPGGTAACALSQRERERPRDAENNAEESDAGKNTAGKNTAGKSTAGKSTAGECTAGKNTAISSA